MRNSWSPFVVSAPGKVILFGEHAVVYGKTAVAGSLNLRAYALVTPRDDATVRLVLPDIDIDVHFSTHTLPQIRKEDLEHPAEIESLVTEAITVPVGPGRTAILTFVYLYACLFCSEDRTSGFTITVRSLLPVGAGLGSSAAFNVALSAAMLKLTGQLSDEGSSAGDKQLINDWAFRGEQVAHGTPSGIDNAVATYGGFVRYRKGEEQTDLQSTQALRVLITNTKVPKSTKALVASVRVLRDRHSPIIDGIMDAIHSISTKAANLFGGPDAGDLEVQLQDMIRINHGLLATLGVSHPALERVRDITGTRGMASKLTGAGGGGCALTLIPNGLPSAEVDAAGKELAEEGFQCYETNVGGPGVLVRLEVKALSVELFVRNALDRHMSLAPSGHRDETGDQYSGVISAFTILPPDAISELSQ
ncbi:mevalonate kinase [Linderina pennispora]|uniref:Mevalonate kinase n=1 Tax=Linderina pennispora TaxID=61395 RepID=A0A1Y1W1V4_9FUNG|nr:mevalonate kinase [Linderina pennispora]ORX67467.1 mevalonate kinase [Linderina pennispora]